MLSTPVRYGDLSDDSALEREVLLVALDNGGDEPLASELRGLPRTPWITVLDAYVENEQVVVVLPMAQASLREGVETGLPPMTAERLQSSLQDTLELLHDRGLSPSSLRPDDLGLTTDGNVLLLPRAGVLTSDDLEEADLLLSVLAAAEDGDVWADEEIWLEDDANEPAEGETSTRVEQWAVAAPGGSAGWRRTSLLVLGTASAVLLTGAVVTSLDRSETASPAAAQQRSEAPVATTSSADSGETLDALVQDLSEDPASAGSRGPALVRQLQQVQRSEGAQRASEAAAALELVDVAQGGSSAVGSRVRAVLQPLAQPADLDGLIALLQVDPASHGELGPSVLDRLIVLRDDLMGEPARTEAQDLAAVIAAGARRDELTNTFAELASGVLQPLAQPPDLPSLIAAVQVQPERFGPRAPALLARLKALAGLPDYAARSEAEGLLLLIEDGVRQGVLSAALQDIAEPVLRPLADPTVT